MICTVSATISSGVNATLCPNGQRNSPIGGSAVVARRTAWVAFGCVVYALDSDVDRGCVITLICISTIKRASGLLTTLFWIERPLK